MQLGHTILPHGLNTLREHTANQLLFRPRLGEQGYAEGGKVGPEEEIEGVEADGSPGCVLNVAMVAVQTVLRKLHPLVIELVARPHPGVILWGEGTAHCEKDPSRDQIMCMEAHMYQLY